MTGAAKDAAVPLPSVAMPVDAVTSVRWRNPTVTSSLLG